MGGDVVGVRTWGIDVGGVLREGGVERGLTRVKVWLGSDTAVASAKVPRRVHPLPHAAAATPSTVVF